jgi:hypothetical protein
MRVTMAGRIIVPLVMGTVVPMIIHHRTPLPVLFNNVPVVPAVSARRQKPPTKRNDRDRAGDLRPTRRRMQSVRATKIMNRSCSSTAASANKHSNGHA